MDDLDRLAEQLAVNDGDRSERPLRIARLCVQMLGVTGAGISLVTDAGNRGVICATDDVAARIEDLQITLGEGPCIDAATTRAPVLIPDLDQPGDLILERWPGFMEGAGSAGVRAVFALPLRIGGIGVGVLDLYRTDPGDLTRGQLSGSLLAADEAALALLHTQTDSQGLFVDGPGGPSAYASQVHQATGMVKAQLDVSIEDAFLSLRARAFAEGRLLAEVADDVVHRRVRFTKEDS